MGTGDYTDRGRSVIAHTPYEGFGDIEELAGATLFPAGERASGFVTGFFIPADGGCLVHKKALYPGSGTQVYSPVFWGSQDEKKVVRKKL
jgi:hypothetical protein